MESELQLAARDFAEHLGEHDGPCDDTDDGYCSRHVEAFDRRLARLDAQLRPV